MYDMYPSDWPSDQGAVAVAERAATPETTETTETSRTPQTPQTSAIRAVQVALDRRDNGGAAAERTHQ